VIAAVIAAADNHRGGSRPSAPREPAAPKRRETAWLAEITDELG